jgi:hypothetical protein
MMQILYYCRAKRCNFHFVIDKQDRDRNTDLWKKNLSGLESHVKTRHSDLLAGNPDWASIVGVFSSFLPLLDDATIENVLLTKRAIEI